MKKKETGLTLIEMIVVLSILVLMVGLMVPMIENFRVNHTVLREREHLKEIEKGVNAWMRDEIFRKGTVNPLDLVFSGDPGPNQYSRFVANGPLNAGTGRSYLSMWFEDEENGQNLKDIWGNDLVFRTNLTPDPDVREIVSYGIDSVAGGADLMITLDPAPWIRRDRNDRVNVINSIISAYNAAYSPTWNDAPTGGVNSPSYQLLPPNAWGSYTGNGQWGIWYLRADNDGADPRTPRFLNTDPRWEAPPTGNYSWAVSSFLRVQ